jgi:tetratricopeptide (TPR) repeat protein
MEINLGELSGKALNLIQGEEKRLRLRQRRARFGVIAAVGGLAVQLIFAALGKLDLNKLGTFLNHLLQLDFNQLWKDGVPISELTGALAIFGGLATYMLLRWTGFLLRESREPFRYTFRIQAFTRVADTPPAERFVLKNEDRFKLLSHDLVERLNQRIKRLSILETDKAGEDETAESFGSHIDIQGHYAIREETKGRWIIEVMPRVRIGPADRPATLAPPVKYPLALPPRNAADGTPVEYHLDADTYNHIVERVHSAVATEVYRQIESDVRNKVTVFPTAYLRAVALGHEAEDFARSNTVDAYDRAIDLYRQALRYFAIANVRPISKFLLIWPILWRKDVRFVHTHARVIIGYTKALIYRRRLAALTGRYLNPLFEIPPLLDDVIRNLRAVQQHVTGLFEPGRENANRAFLTFPRDTWWRYVTRRPDQSLFEAQRHVLFDALVAAALTYFYLDAIKLARQHLEDARAIDPQRSQQDALFLLTEAEIEPALHKEIILFQKAAEVAPDFQIANYLYAYHCEMLFRARDELTPERAARVIAVYDDVLLRINPGNIAAIAAQGYLYWLLGKNDEALRKFEQGRDLKSIIRETFVGVLNYGLARIAAEQGRFNECYDRYMEAVSADPGVATYSTDARARANGAYYEYITPEILRRYRAYHTAARTALTAAAGATKDADGSPCSERTRLTVLSFVLNDYANACLNYYMRFGDEHELQEALATYAEAVMCDPANAAAYYNLASGQMIKGGDSDLMLANFSKAEARAPTWPTVLTATAKAQMEAINRAIAAQRKARLDLEARHERELADADLRRRSRERRGEVSQFQNAPEGQDRRRGQEQESGKRGDYERKLADIDDAIAQQRGRIKTDVAQRLQQAFQRTRFGAVLENSRIDEEPVNRLMRLPIDRSRIDENDIEALKLLADVLVKSTADADPAQARRIREAARRLCRFLRSYYPEDFDRDLLMYDMYAVDEESNRADLEETRAHIRTRVTRWLEVDPVHFAGCTWLPDARAGFDVQDGQRLLDTAIAAAPANAVTYHVIAGDMYYLAGDVPKAIGEYSAAVTPTAKSAAHANRLGNAYFRNWQYVEAVPWYETAIKLSPHDADYHANLGGALRRAQQWERSVAAYTEARRLEPEVKEHRESPTSVFNEWGNELSALGREREAIEKYQAALELAPTDAVIRANLSSSWAALKEPGHRTEALEHAIDELRKAVEHTPDTAEYSRRLAGLESSRRLAAQFGEHVLDRLPVVTPVAMELSADLIPFVAGATPNSLAPLAAELTTQMRERVRGEMGLGVPGVRYRGNETDFPDGTYVLMLNDVPVERGDCDLKRRFSPGPRGRLVELGVPIEDATRPDTGEPGFWVPAAQWRTVLDAGLPLWEVLEYPIRHLERVVRRNLALFFGHQELDNVLEDNTSPAAKAIRQDGRELTALVIALRALVQEGVPIVAFQALIDRFAELRALGASLGDIVAQLRLIPDVRAALPGTQPTTVLRRVGRSLESDLHKALGKENGRFVLALDPEHCQSLLATVREQVGEGREALLVRDGALRPFVRKLVEGEFPDLSVLAAEELKDRALPPDLPVVEIES